MDVHSMVGKIMRGQLIDPSEVSAEQLTEFIKEIVMMDEVTGISNATGLHAFIGRMQAQGRMDRYDVFFINIKSMRIINEKWGRQGGNQVLFQYANRIKELTHPDGFVARMGGDNFFAFVNKNNRDYFIKNATKVQMQLEMDGEVWTEKVEARMGIYEIHPGEMGADAMEASSMALQFIRISSDQLLSVYSPEMKQKDFNAKKLKDSFKDALINEEFLPFYQPKVNIWTGEVCGAEALARWRHGDEMISPAEFVPILEQTGAICRLDFYMLEHLCRDIRQWQDKGLTPVKVSCNFSKKHLCREQFAEKIIRTIEHYQIDPKYIEIELTETYEADDSRALKSFIEQMQIHGIGTSIDDFGNAYSSLRLLKDMKAETVKIDKSLIDNVGKGIRENDAIAGNMVRMLLDLGKEVIVEGVEEEEQIEFLKKVDCSIVQGYYYAKPMPEEEFEKWLV